MFHNHRIDLNRVRELFPLLFAPSRKLHPPARSPNPPEQYAKMKVRSTHARISDQFEGTAGNKRTLFPNLPWSADRRSSVPAGKRCMLRDWSPVILEVFLLQVPPSERLSRNWQCHPERQKCCPSAGRKFATRGWNRLRR